MENNRKTGRNEYKSWSETVVRYSKTFIAGICILGVALAVAIKILDITAVVFWVSIIAIVIWCGSAFLVLKKMQQKEKTLRAAAKTERPEISNPLFKELFDEYEYNQLEGFTQNIFFHTWKLTCIDDYNNIISLCFTKKQHEIAIDLSENDISIIIDEETDSPVELVMNMHDFNSIDEVLNTITAACRYYFSKKNH